MSVLSDVNLEHFTHPGSNHRTVTAIQQKIIEKGERNLASRIVHVMEDRDAIATWRRDLNGILQIFNVRSVLSTLYDG